MAVMGTGEEAKGVRVVGCPGPRSVPAQAERPKETVMGRPAHPRIPEASLAQQFQDFFSD